MGKWIKPLGKPATPLDLQRQYLCLHCNGKIDYRCEFNPHSGIVTYLCKDCLLALYSRFTKFVEEIIENG